jgi:hypothetical protein
LLCRQLRLERSGIYCGSWRAWAGPRNFVQHETGTKQIIRWLVGKVLIPAFRSSRSQDWPLKDEDVPLCVKEWTAVNVSYSLLRPQRLEYSFSPMLDISLLTRWIDGKTSAGCISFMAGQRLKFRVSAPAAVRRTSLLLMSLITVCY